MESLAANLHIYTCKLHVRDPNKTEFLYVSIFSKMIVLEVDFTQLTPKFSDQVSLHQRSITCLFKDLSNFFAFYWSE